MTTRQQARAAHRKASQWKPPFPGADVAVVTGWCLTADDLPETRTQTHDALIELLGDRRTSGVAWQQACGTKALVLLINLAGASRSDDQAIAAHYRQLEALLSARGGWIVAAMATHQPAEVA